MLFGNAFRRWPRVIAALFQAYTYVSPVSAVTAQKRLKGNALTLREVLDLALDQELFMSAAGATRLREALASRLPPIWPGELGVQLDLSHADSPDCFTVTVPSRFHNRLHRFPFEDGFLVCPVPDCTGKPKLRGTLHLREGAKGQPSCILEHACDAGHHWQCIFQEEESVTAISVIRLKRIC